ncbi:MAG TPA: cob(I)yrinic acid a,c-diamide adenosyltransferase [Acidimicrobiales bacterium]|jgi:cob(I)alamin adenosyltransferase
MPSTARQPRIYTRTGDDGTTGLLYGGRAPKSSPRIELNGVVDEAQAALGVARAESVHGSALDDLLVAIEQDLYVLMAEVATLPAHRDKLAAGSTLVTEPMVTDLERRIDELLGRFEMPSEFVVPGRNRTAAALDVARTVVRRAERLVSSVDDLDDGSLVGPYLNRLSDLVWALARWQEGDEHLFARRDASRQGGQTGPGGSGGLSDPGGGLGGPGDDRPEEGG